MNTDKRENEIINPEKITQEIAKLKMEITDLESKRRESGKIRLQAKREGNVELEINEAANSRELDAKINELTNLRNDKIEKVNSESEKLREELKVLEEKRRESGEIRLQARKDGNYELESQETANSAKLNEKIEELKDKIELLKYLNPNKTRAEIEDLEAKRRESGKIRLQAKRDGNVELEVNEAANSRELDTKINDLKNKLKDEISEINGEISKLENEKAELEEKRRKSGAIRLQARKDENYELESQEITNSLELNTRIAEVENKIKGLKIILDPNIEVRKVKYKSADKENLQTESKEYTAEELYQMWKNYNKKDSTIDIGELEEKLDKAIEKEKIVPDDVKELDKKALEGKTNKELEEICYKRDATADKDLYSYALAKSAYETLEDRKNKPQITNTEKNKLVSIKNKFKEMLDKIANKFKEIKDKVVNFVKDKQEKIKGSIKNRKNKKEINSVELNDNSKNERNEHEEFTQTLRPKEVEDCESSKQAEVTEKIYESIMKKENNSKEREDNSEERY